MMARLAKAERPGELQGARDGRTSGASGPKTRGSAPGGGDHPRDEQEQAPRAAEFPDDAADRRDSEEQGRQDDRTLERRSAI